MKSLILRLILLISIITFIENKKMKYRCGINNLKIKPKVLMPKFKINKEDPLNKRKLDDIDEDGFKSFNIYIDKKNIKKELELSDMDDYEEIITDALDKAGETLEKLLRVKPIEDGLQFSNDELFDLGLTTWEYSSFGNKALRRNIDMKSLGIDLIIFSSLQEMEEETIAAASPVFTQDSNHQPILGIIYINSLIDFEKINVEKYIESTLIHEMTHILGFTGNFFENVFHNVIKKTDKYGISRQYINSPKVLEVARKYFNCPSIDGVELENYGDEGTAGSHWEARILLGDYMNGVAYTEEVVSEFSLALLEDTGYYMPNYYTGGLMRYGKNKGCEFFYDKCINEKQEVNPYFENEFFDSIYSDFEIDASCSSGRLSRTYNMFWEYESLPKEYQYFSEPGIGGWGAADYCPLPGNHYEEEIDVYYPGICSGEESGVYGAQIPYPTSDDNIEYYTNEELSPLTGEEISDESFCFLSSLIRNDISDIENYSSVIRANCYIIFCSEKSLTLKINDDYVVCPRSGGKIKVDGYEGYLLCPDYNLMCSGTVICNDLFDCVDKESVVKEESYLYDYEIKTSQNIERAETSDEDDINNYELSDDGICPKYCKHCLEDNICLKCKEDYEFLGDIETDEIICVHKDELSVGYFSYYDIYYKCLDNCDICLDLDTCEQCQDGIDYIYDLCINIDIPNCEESDFDGICEKCEDNFSFNGTDRNFCIEIENFGDNYFTIDDGISFFLCSDEISNCDICKLSDEEDEQNIICNSCKNGYFLSLNENKCLAKEEIDKNKNYFYIDNNSVKKCSDAIENCFQCSNENTCDKCINKFYLVNDNKTNCVRKSEINPINEYYLDTEKNPHTAIPSRPPA